MSIPVQADQEPARKKPVGGVALFGGIDPLNTSAAVTRDNTNNSADFGKKVVGWEYIYISSSSDDDDDPIYCEVPDL